MDIQPEPHIDQQQVFTATSPEGDIVCLSHLVLNEQVIINLVKSDKAGGVCCFIGTTRDTFQDKIVTKLSYTSYTSLALKTMLKIVSSLRSKYPIEAITIHHRLGSVPVGSTSIVIVVSCPHRREAFECCEEALEEIKKNVQIWKWEEYEGREVVGGGITDGGVDGNVGAWKENFPIELAPAAK